MASCNHLLNSGNQNGSLVVEEGLATDDLHIHQTEQAQSVGWRGPREQHKRRDEEIPESPAVYGRLAFPAMRMPSRARGAHCQ